MPRAKRAKQYRKLMQYYGITFGFREPYQVIIDASLLLDATRFKMDLEKGLEQTLSGTVKPMITQCSMRHLYARKSDGPHVEAAIEHAKTWERRRCGHHPTEYINPLPEIKCICSVIDPKDSGTNKHRYCVAANDQPIRVHLRQVAGVPLIYISRSVMIMEPMATGTVALRAKAEREKLRDEIKPDGKRKREDDDEAAGAQARDEPTTEAERKKKKKKKGPSGPNPLSVKKPKKPKTEGQPGTTPKDTETGHNASESLPAAEVDDATADKPKKKRKRRPKKAPGAATEEGTGEEDSAPALNIHEA